MTSDETQRLHAIRHTQVVRASMQQFMVGLAVQLDARADEIETASKPAPVVLREIAAELRETAALARAGAR
jgi:hypothetical protein